MANNAKKYIKLAILAVVSMIIGSVITIAIKDFDVAKVNTNKTEVSYSKTKKGFDSLYETYDTIMSEYYKDVDSDKLIEGAINGMLESLDDEHTMYFDKKSKENCRKKFVQKGLPWSALRQYRLQSGSSPR